VTDGPNRDRDPAGRPLNARPRDELGRPLPRGAAGVEPLPEVIDLSPDQTLVLAQRLLDEGRPFQAHEVLESAWKSAPPTERDLWQGLAQIAVAVTHAKRGNTEGAATLIQRARTKIAPYGSKPPYSIDVRSLIDWCDKTLIELQKPADSIGTPILCQRGPSA
jgi:hypothetical protein